MPPELDEILRRIMQLEIEREALRKEDDGASRASGAARKRVGDAARGSTKLRAHWDAEKNAAVELRKIREQIEATKVEIEQAERQYDLNRVAELGTARLPQLEKS